MAQAVEERGPPGFGGDGEVGGNGSGLRIGRRRSRRRGSDGDLGLRGWVATGGFDPGERATEAGFELGQFGIMEDRFVQGGAFGS